VNGDILFDTLDRAGESVYVACELGEIAAEPFLRELGPAVSLEHRDNHRCEPGNQREEGEPLKKSVDHG
jgi:hypothetical protein